NHNSWQSLKKIFLGCLWKFLLLKKGVFFWKKFFNCWDGGPTKNARKGYREYKLFFRPPTGERRGGEEGRTRGGPDPLKKKKKIKKKKQKKKKKKKKKKEKQFPTFLYFVLMGGVFLFFVFCWCVGKGVGGGGGGARGGRSDT
ncbi:hypothetical protein, partial [Bacillus anthracis]|uniref:hypothetical protein n=1 Tax=Bacillus anthracis TaxID=1392 RepID=UPI000E19A54C